jgi:hypothetical protein
VTIAEVLLVVFVVIPALGFVVSLVGYALFAIVASVVEHLRGR